MESTLFTALTVSEEANLSGGDSFILGVKKAKADNGSKLGVGFGSSAASFNSSGGDTNNGGSGQANLTLN